MSAALRAVQRGRLAAFGAAASFGAITSFARLAYDAGAQRVPSSWHAC